MNNRIIWLIRHGNRLDFSNPEWLDTAERPHDCPLSPQGQQQARDTGVRLRREPVSVFSNASRTFSCVITCIIDANDNCLTISLTCNPLIRFLGMAFAPFLGKIPCRRVYHTRSLK